MVKLCSNCKILNASTKFINGETKQTKISGKNYWTNQLEDVMCKQNWSTTFEKHDV